MYVYSRFSLPVINRNMTLFLINIPHTLNIVWRNTTHTVMFKPRRLLLRAILKSDWEIKQSGYVIKR